MPPLTVASTSLASRAPRRPGYLAAQLLGAALACAFVHPASAAVQLPERFNDQLVASGLNEPVGMAFLPDDRLIVIERAGALRLIGEGKIGAVDPLVVIDGVDPSGDRGATGIAIDPGWPNRPYIYVYFDAADQTCKISRYTAGGDLNAPSSLYLTIDPATRYDILADIPDLQEVHNGGSIRFGPDGMLYAALGEDGFACAAQDTSSLRGVVIRIDVSGLPDGGGGPPSKALIIPPDNPLVGNPSMNARMVWATGLRNPFRFHFDPVTGDIFLADVGFGLFEEVDQLRAPLENFGWPYFEGPAGYVSSCPGIVPAPTLEPPIYAYDRTGFTASIIGGGVYRGGPCNGCNFPAEYEGDYFFSDFYAGFLRRLKFDGHSWNLAPIVPNQPNGQDWGLGFQEAAEYQVGRDGALWYSKMGYDFLPGTGEIRRIFYSAPVSGAPAPSGRAASFSTPMPTPSRGRTTLAYELPRDNVVSLDILDAQGRVTRQLVPERREAAGPHHVTWDGQDADGRGVAPGVYLALLHAGPQRLVRRLVIVR